MTHSTYNPFTAPELDGLVEGMTMAEYHAAPAIGRSSLNTLLRTSPWEYQWLETHKDKAETDLMRLGTACHTTLLEPDLFHTSVCTYKGLTKAGKPTTDRKGAMWEAFKEEHKEWTILTPAQWRTVELIQNEVAQYKGIRALLDGGLIEKSLFHQDEITGELVKSRLDMIDPHRGFILDIKFSGQVHHTHRVRSILDLGYHVQSHMGMDGGNRAYGAGTFKEAYILWIRTTGAPRPVLRRMGPEWMAKGEEDYRTALDLYAKCKASGEWPRGPLEASDEHWPEWLDQ